MMASYTRLAGQCNNKIPQSKLQNSMYRYTQCQLPMLLSPRGPDVR